MAEDYQINPRDWDRLSADARALLRMLAGLREGRTVSELADRVGQAADAVVDAIEVNDKGKVSGPTGNAVLKLTIRPNPYDATANTVRIEEEVTGKYPQERYHDVFVGRGGSLHLRDAERSMLFSVVPKDSGRGVDFVSPEDDSPAALPYKDS